jgi:hypothetical protein
VQAVPRCVSPAFMTGGGGLPGALKTEQKPGLLSMKMRKRYGGPICQASASHCFGPALWPDVFNFPLIALWPGVHKY